MYKVVTMHEWMFCIETAYMESSTVQFKMPLYWRLNYTVLLFYKEFHSTPSALNTAPFW